MDGMCTILVLGVVTLLPSICVSLTCLQCTDSIAPRDCGRVKKCGSHEACFIDQHITPSGFIRYNLGCRDRRFCTATAGRRSIAANNGSMIRQSRDVKLCTACCDTDICNNAGCGATGYPSRQNRGPVCYACAQQTSPETCDVITVCGKNSICKVKFKDHLGIGDVYYSSTCEDAQICHQEAQFNNAIAVGRRRAITEEVDTAFHQCVVKCCDSDLCNGQCGTGGTSLLPTSATHTCTHQCVHGHCHYTGTSYVCQCNSGYTGTRCDYKIEPHRTSAPACYNSNCITGKGCVGWTGACAGICYCEKSGYEYRCYRECDVAG